MKPYMIRACAMVMLICASYRANAIVISELPRFFVVGTEIADLQDPPVSFMQTIADSAIVSLTMVEVGLHLVGSMPGSGFASEMYVALTKDPTIDARTSILLNQAGISANNAVGAGYDGWNVVFSDAASNGDVHQATLNSGILEGSWAPDGRTDPTSMVRSQLLSVFNGASGNGDWYISIADLAIGGTMRLESWSLTLTGETASSTSSIPEGGYTLAYAFLALICLGTARYWKYCT